jgi:hypothetical protein
LPATASKPACSSARRARHAAGIVKGLFAADTLSGRRRMLLSGKSADRL